MGDADVIRAARRKKGWSQAELGEQAGVERQMVAKAEADCRISPEATAKLAQALSVRLGG